MLFDILSYFDINYFYQISDFNDLFQMSSTGLAQDKTRPGVFHGGRGEPLKRGLQKQKSLESIACPET